MVPKHIACICQKEPLSYSSLTLQTTPQYGGTHQGERKLANKLARKYGSTVKLLLLPKSLAHDTNQMADVGFGVERNEINHDEFWYHLRSEEADSGVVDLLSLQFDPFAVLKRDSRNNVTLANPWMEDSSMILDNIGKCATLLPEDDPLHRDSYHSLQLRKAATSKHPCMTLQPSLLAKLFLQNHINKDPNDRPCNNTYIHPFDAIAMYLDSGPLSLLARLRKQRKRVGIVVRYVNMVRGIVTGILIAFDKHMNMILKDVEEVYSSRLVGADCLCSNLNKNKSGLELSQYYNSIYQQQYTNQPEAWNVRKRQIKQLLVRGDIVVSICEDKKHVTKSIYIKTKRSCEEKSSER